MTGMFMLATPGGPGANEHILIGGRVQLASAIDVHAASESRRFEVSITRRNGSLVSAEACLFSDLSTDSWDGGCFQLEPNDLEDGFSADDWDARQVPTVHPGAQMLLRVLAEQGADRFGGKRIVGFDPRANLDFFVGRFGEADL